MEGPQEGTPERLLLCIPEVAEVLGIGRTKIYEMIATGELPTVRFGRAVRVSVNTLQKWVAEREQRSIPEYLQYNAQRSNILKERTVA
jgi:excisionase family DNA binding protein